MNETQSLAQQVQNAKQLAANRLLRQNFFANVVGIGLGKKLVDGAVTDTRCVRVYVQSKLGVQNLSPAALLPESFLDIPTDIIEVGRFGRTGSRPRPREDKVIGPGSPIRVDTRAPNVNAGFAGSLGAVVQDSAGYQYTLSCNHVLRVNGRVPGDARIVSAAWAGTGYEPYPIATPGPFVELRRDQSNSVDCALARLDDSRRVLPAFPAGIGKLKSADPIPPDRGMKVEKAGAVTGITNGTIVDINADLFVDYSFGTFRFTDQVVIDSGKDDVEFAADGDSGSIVIDTQTKQATAMIFAESGRFAVACPLTDVLEQLAPQVSGKLTLVV